MRRYHQMLFRGMTVNVQLVESGDAGALQRVAPGVFDGPVDPRWSAEFLADARHHLAVAIDDGVIVGMASAVHYVHPDKAPQLFINEVGVAPTYQHQGIGRRMLDVLLDRGRMLRCTEAWVLTDRSNTIAQRLYAATSGAVAPEDAMMYTFFLEPRAIPWTPD